MTPRIVLFVSDVADILNISKRLAYNLFKQADFPGMKIGQFYCVRMDRLYSWLLMKTKKEVEDASKKNKPSKAARRTDG